MMNKKIPAERKFKIKSKNIYARTKKLNEEIAYDLSRNTKVRFIGLRFFYCLWRINDQICL